MAAIEGSTELERLVSRSRLIGADRTLVLHGGGNTSTKLVETDHLGRERRVIRIKGSGSDLATITAADFPGLWLDELLPLREREAMTDEEMVAYLSHCLVEPDAARPSIETLLHAFLPAAHVDHVHADAICALANAPDANAAVRDALGPDVAVVEYVRPGFELSCRVADLADARAVVLAHHGLVTWGETHEASYGLTLELVFESGRSISGRACRSRSPATRAKRSSFGCAAASRPSGASCSRRTRLSACSPIGPMSTGWRRCAARPTTCFGSAATPPWSKAMSALASSASGPSTGIDPRVFLVPGHGVIAAAPDSRAAGVRLEIAAHTHASVGATLDRFGGSSWLDDAEVHDFEYWPLELYKLTLAPPPAELAGYVALVTGAASGIGRDIALDLAARGAHLVLADIDAAGLAETAEGLERAVALPGDLTDEAVVDRLVRVAVGNFGGIDAVVFNAGVASTGPLETLPEQEWRRSLEVNLTAHFLLTRRVLGPLREQGLGGSLVYVASKNAFAPGAGFGPYSVAKAGLVQLMRIAALEGGPLGIRSNAVNPDAIFAGSKLWSDDLRRERAEAHGVELEEIEAFYASRSLLGRAVTGADVAEAVAFLVSDRSRSTTGAVLPVDGGVPAAFPR